MARPSSSPIRWYEILVGLLILFGILSAILYPPGSSPSAAKKAFARNDTSLIAAALTTYQSEHGRWPITPPTSPAIVGGDLLKALLGNNSRSIRYLEVPTADPTDHPNNKGGLNAEGEYLDPWGAPYHYLITTNPKRPMRVPGGTTTNIVAVWSAGAPNSSGPNTNPEQFLKSW